MRRPDRLAHLRRLGAGALLGLAAATATATAAPCTVVFGQGRNPPTEGAPDWDALNAQFTTEVGDALEAAGRRVHVMSASSVQIDPGAAGLALLQQADRLGCHTLVETAVFVDEHDTLVLRLRAYPLLPQLGDGAAIVGLRIGAPLFVTQRDMDFNALPRLRPGRIAQQMAAEYLQRDAR